jgi:hypothetical protein
MDTLAQETDTAALREDLAEVLDRHGVAAPGLLGAVMVVVTKAGPR